MAMGQIVMWFTPFNKELERTPVKAIIQELMNLYFETLGSLGRVHKPKNGILKNL